MKDQPYKVITLLIQHNAYTIANIETIHASSLKAATLLVRDIQQAEIKENNLLTTDYQLLLKYSQKVGVVDSESNSKLIVLGQDNEWYQYLDNEIITEWKDIIMVEWEDYLNEILTN